MSEYQYYEFQAIDRPLTPEEQRAVASLSSRVSPHPRRAVFVYNWGDFRGDPEQVLTRYYDAMLYFTNWGSRQLMFRFPKALVDVNRMRQYTVRVEGNQQSDAMGVSTAGDYVVLNLQYHEEGGDDDWLGGEGILDGLLELRGALLQGDNRTLYLAWLMGINSEFDVDESALEPPVPAGLRELSPALENFVEFFNIDPDLIDAAAERSPALHFQKIDRAGIRAAVAALPVGEKDEFLVRLAQGEPHLTSVLLRRLQADQSATMEAASQRTVEALLAQVEVQAERRRAAERAEIQARRRSELKALAEQGEAAWEAVETFIQAGNAGAYAQAGALLVNLKELAESRGTVPDFQTRLDGIVARYRRRSALMAQLRELALM